MTPMLNRRTRMILVSVAFLATPMGFLATLPVGLSATLPVGLVFPGPSVIQAADLSSIAEKTEGMETHRSSPYRWSYGSNRVCRSQDASAGRRRWRPVREIL